MKRINIKHPEHLGYSETHIASSFRLYRNGDLPSVLQGWMLVVPLKHALRAIYGSDVRAAWALLREAVAECFRCRWYLLLFKLGWKPPGYEADTEEGKL